MPRVFSSRLQVAPVWVSCAPSTRLDEIEASIMAETAAPRGPRRKAIRAIIGKITIGVGNRTGTKARTLTAAIRQ